MLPPHILEAFAEMQQIDTKHQRQTRESRILLGRPWYTVKDDDTLAKLSVSELNKLLKANGVDRHSSYLNKCAKLFYWSKKGRLQEMDEFCERTGFTPKDKSEPYASMEIEAALRAEEAQRTIKRGSSPNAPIERSPLDYLGADSNPRIPNINIVCGDSFKLVHDLANDSLDVFGGSPPYHGCRDYQHPDQMGLEPNDKLYRARIVALLRAARPIIKDTGLIFLVVGDRFSYGPNPGTRSDTHYDRHPATPATAIRDDIPAGWPMRIPDALYEDLISDDWVPVQKIILYKSDAAPEPVRRRLPQTYETILVLAKTEKYFWNVEAKTPVMTAPKNDRSRYQRERDTDVSDRVLKSYRNVWVIPKSARSKTLKHPARYPVELIRRVLRLMCPENGHVCDPWGGSGTTAVAALELGLDATLFELNPDYVVEAKNRLAAIPEARKWRKPLILPNGKLIHDDGLRECRRRATGSIGFALLDPPYASGSTALDWDEDLPWDELWEELWRVLRIDGFVAICCDARLLSRLIHMQPTTFRHVVHWFRPRHANIMQGKSQPKRHIEYVATFGRVARASYTPQMTPIEKPFSRPKRALLTKLFGEPLGLHAEGERNYDMELPMDLRFYDWESGEKVQFATQKPVALANDLIKTYARPGDTILDITTGTGTFALASMRLGYQFIAVERDEKHFQIASDRLSHATASPGSIEYRDPQLELDFYTHPEIIGDGVADVAADSDVAPVSDVRSDDGSVAMQPIDVRHRDAAD